MDIPSRPTATRRGLLTGVAAAGIGSTAGCLRRLRNLSGRAETDQPILRIKVLPNDVDPFSSQIASHLAAGLEAAGIDARLVPTGAEALYQELLFGGEFDLYVAKLPQPPQPDPDVLYPLLHSRFSAELGWQNPFGFTNLNCDELLAAQRAPSDTRKQTVDELQTLLAQTQPFVPIYLPEMVTAVRSDRVRGWETAVQELPYGLLRVSPVEGKTLRLVSTDDRIGSNRNPISAIHHQNQSLIELLYEPLVVTTSERRLPWLATEVDWDDEPLTATVELREGLRWHDGEPLTADDVVFSYQFIADTSRDSATNPIPAPRFRGESTLIEDSTAQTDRQLTIEFIETTQPVAEQALSVPIVPPHHWEAYTELVSVAGVEIDADTTEALITDNAEAVGSGPFMFSEATAGEQIVFSRFDDHFLRTTDDDRLADFHGGPAVETLEVELITSHTGAVELLSVDGVDATFSPISPGAIDLLADESAITTHTHRSESIYHIGFNTRYSPLSNPNFRRLVARLVDKAFLVDEVFDGFGEPVASPLAGTDWLAASLEWTGDADPAVPFIGVNGTVNEGAARDAFREAGFRYNDEGELQLPDS